MPLPSEDVIKNAVEGILGLGVVGTIVDRFLKRKELKMADDVAIRQELREEVKILNKRIDDERLASQVRFDKQAGEFQERFNRLESEYRTAAREMQAEHKAAIQKLVAEVDTWRDRYYGEYGRRVELAGKIQRIPELRESMAYIEVQDELKSIDSTHPHRDPNVSDHKE